MGAFDFRRCEGYIPQQFIDSSFPVCPVCGSHNPCWTLKDTVEQAAARVMFRCSECSCILSASAADLSVMTANSTGSADGKDVQTAYMKVESTGSARAAKFSAGKAIPFGELKGIAASSSQPAANAQNATPLQPQAPQQPYAATPQSQPQQPYAAAPQSQPQQPYAAAQQGYPQQPYAAAQQSQPQQPYAAAPQGYPQQPYAAVPQGYSQQPYAVYTGQRVGKQLGKLNIAAFVLAAFFTLAMIAPLTAGIFWGTGFMLDIPSIFAGILLVFGVYKRDKTGNALFATGLFIFALITALHNTGDLAIDICNQFTMPVLAVAGVSYLVNNKTMRTLKVIAMIILIVVSNVWIFWYGFYFWRILAMLAYAALGVCGILFKPAEKS